MAYIGRAMPTSSMTAVAAGRQAAASSNVASVVRTPVEALAPKLGTSLEDAFLFHARQDDGQPQPENQISDPALGLVRSTTQAFAAFLELDGGNDDGAEGRLRGGPTSFAGILTRAIHTYETNARVISGAMVQRGTTLSVNL